MKSSEIAERLRTFLPAELRRARRQLSGAQRKNPDDSVHEARKSIKKLRAALRLAQGMAPEAAVDALGNALREAAHSLGPLRDHLVLNETGRDLIHPGEEKPPEPQAPKAGPLLNKARGKLRRTAGLVSRLIQAQFDEATMEAGVRRIYKRAEKEMRNAHNDESDEAFHAWRRRAKDLLYVLELIKAPARLVKKLDKLTKQLGDDHDLATFLAHHDSRAGKEAHGRLLARAKKKRAPLQKKAMRLGKKIFAARPRKFARSLVN